MSLTTFDKRKQLATTGAESESLSVREYGTKLKIAKLKYKFSFVQDEPVPKTVPTLPNKIKGRQTVRRKFYQFPHLLLTQHLFLNLPHLNFFIRHWLRGVDDQGDGFGHWTQLFQRSLHQLTHVINRRFLLNQSKQNV